jgi:RNA polymerase sigma-70 factor (ECF subfamily)
VAQHEWSKLSNHANPQAIDEADSLPMESANTADEVDALLGKLKPLEREAIRLHHLEGCSYSEVARQLKVPLNSIGPLLSRARRKIQATRPGNL